MTSNNVKNGFTLIEILIVMLIIGITSTFVVLKVGTFNLSNKKSAGFAREITGLIELLHQQSIFSMETLGVQISDNEFSFLRLNSSNNTRWEPMAESDPFWASRTIPPDLTISYKLNDTKNMLKAFAFAPQIILQPSGEITPFTISISQRGSHKTYIISSGSSTHVEFTEART